MRQNDEGEIWGMERERENFLKKKCNGIRGQGQKRVKRGSGNDMYRNKLGKIPLLNLL